MFWDDEVRGRVVKIDGEMILYCQDGTYVKVTPNIIKNILLGFRDGAGLGAYQHEWDMRRYDTVMQIPGETLLVYTSRMVEIFDSIVLNKVLAQGNPLEYISATEYGKLHNCSASRIKKLCSEQRILGSIKIGGQWFIYRYADYPKDERIYRKKITKEN